MRRRPTARLIVVDEYQRVLLFRLEDPAVAEPDAPRADLRRGIFWCTPGGGLEPGEGFETAARRELREETGIAAEIGPCLLEREKTLQFSDERVCFVERYFLVRVSGGAVRLDGHTALERRLYRDRDHRWWTLAELVTTEETVVPEELAAIIRQVLRSKR